jgi:hypothetical protein
LCRKTGGAGGIHIREYFEGKIFNTPQLAAGIIYNKPRKYNFLHEVRKPLKFSLFLLDILGVIKGSDLRAP